MTIEEGEGIMKETPIHFTNAFSSYCKNPSGVSPLNTPSTPSSSFEKQVVFFQIKA